MTGANLQACMMGNSMHNSTSIMKFFINLLLNQVMLCEDDTGNTYLLRPVKRDKGNWDPNEVTKSN